MESHKTTSSNYILRAINLRAENLVVLHKKPKDDTFLVLEFRGVKKTTEPSSIAEKTEWKEDFKWDLHSQELKHDEFVKIKIYQKESFWRNRMLGKAKVCLQDLLERQENKLHLDIPLTDNYINPVEPQCRFSCELEYIVTTQNGQGKSKSTESEKKGKMAPEMTNDNTKVRELINKSRFSLSDKPIDFQIRVKIFEARQLEGNNVSPVTRVTVGNKRKQTSVQKSTNRPYFNQSLIYNFDAIKPSDLFSKQIKFEIFDSGMIRTGSLLGYFKCDVGFVYDWKDHCLLRKWLLLIEPKDGESLSKKQDASKNDDRESIDDERAHAGYLKASVVVLHPGATAPSMEDIGCDLDQDDLETNLIRPPGVVLTPAVFKVKIYRADDLPQMDPNVAQTLKRVLGIKREPKHLVDPYCVVSFAGAKRSTKIRYNSSSPTFLEVLNVPFQFPSMCDKLKIQLIDWDLATTHDVIGTKFLDLAEISHGRDGYLPSFGPCYINLYGSMREFSSIPSNYDELNEGKGEGAAYRGRVLVEIETELNPSHNEERGSLNSDDIAEVAPFQRRKKFCLLATFLEATMLSVHDTPIEFEVSIGNCGNKMDNSFQASSSTTPPTNPVFDGERYYYLPWAGTKPYVRIDCEWEDITFRLGALNRILRACQRLEKSIDRVKESYSKGEHKESVEELCKLLDILLKDCQTLGNQPTLRKPDMTNLDVLLTHRRNTTLNELGKEATELKQKVTNIKKAVKTLETVETVERFLMKLRSIAIEPQNSMPDVIIWMIKGGAQRIAYCRIPAHELLYTSDKEQQGINCGKIIDVILKYPGKQDQSKKHAVIPGLLRVMLRLGLEEHSIDEWQELTKTGGKLMLYAETYENQHRAPVPGKWTTTLLRRPLFSNAKGTLSLPKDDFIELTGWRFDKEWCVRPETSTHFSKDTGHKRFLEDAFQNEYRMLPGGTWRSLQESPWTDNNGETLTDKEGNAIKNVNDIILPKYWTWESNEGWKVDVNRAVDHDGWEYAFKTTFGSTDYEAVEKIYHLCRRRRWTRERKLLGSPHDFYQLTMPAEDHASKDGWEYATTFSSRFHREGKYFDFVRRRRWHRRLVRTDSTAPEPVFRLGAEKEKDLVLDAPRIFLSFERPLICQFRAHLYQARNLLPSDPNGLADPYVRLSFCTRSATSSTITKSLNPTWNEMLLIDYVPIYGHYEQVIENPPDVLMELFDSDSMLKGKDDFLGRAQAEPIVFLPDRVPEAKLSWHKIWKKDHHCGDILAVFQVFVENDCAPALPSPVDSDIYTIPENILPKTTKHMVEVLCWGLRDLKRFKGLSVKSPWVEIEMGQTTQQTNVLENIKTNPNFQENRVLCFHIDLPEKGFFTPPITIRVRDNRLFGRRPTVGVCVIESAKIFLNKKTGSYKNVTKSPASGAIPDHRAVVIEQDNTRNETVIEEEEEEGQRKFDWWSKYYASREKTRKMADDYPPNFDTMEIHPDELEEHFENFQDFIQTFPLRRGKVHDPEYHENESSVGEFKGSICIYPLCEKYDTSLQPQFFKEKFLPKAEPIKCTVRVYIVKAYDLMSKDLNGLADPYLVVSLGKKSHNDRDGHACDVLAVDFGKMFEFKARIPIEKDLKIQVMDYDFASDDLIGETVIDLENRFLSRRHAMAGLPKTYTTSGLNKWPFGKKYRPTEILTNHCNLHYSSQPRFNNVPNSDDVCVEVDGVLFLKLSDFEHEKIENDSYDFKCQRLALRVLHDFNNLVCEHVETRNLYSSLYPGFPQGKLEMFVHIFPEYCGEPGPPIDITPRQPKKYELRVIVWNTCDVFLQEGNLLGEQMSDIYVKCWLAGNEKQRTDIHYRSLNGEGMFNWRMLFPFEFLAAEKMILVKKKDHIWNLSERVEKAQPRLTLQVWDNDLISRDDFIGSIDLDLKALGKPFSNPNKIKNLSDYSKRKAQSLFEIRRIYGWLPIYGYPKEKGKSKKKKNDKKITGKVEITMELLEFDEANAKPAGKGRDEPNQHPALEKPKRPKTSFLWIWNPWRSFRFIIWRNYKWYIIGAILLVLIIILLLLFIYSAPGYSVKKLFNA